MTRLLLRADAGRAMGIGHLGRVVAYAEEACARDWQVAVSGTLADAEWLVARLDELSVERLSPARDATALGAMARDFDVVLVDDYGLGELRTDVNAAGAELVSMEDGAFGRRAADVVVDCGLSPDARAADGSDEVLTGAAYVPIRDDVLAARRLRASAPPAHERPRLVVVLGGGDAGRETLEPLMNALRDSGSPFHADVLTRGEPRLPTPGEGQRFVPAEPHSGLPGLLAGADLVVSAAGVTMTELCCIGVPSALVQLVDNQSAGYRAAVDKGIAVGLGPAEELAHSTEAAAERLHALLSDAAEREAYGARAAEVVDGRGRARVLDVVAKRLT